MLRLVLRRRAANGGAGDEAGIAMITVITLSTLLLLTVSIFATRAVSDLDQSTEDRARERALHVGESGVDDVLARLVQDKTFNTADSTCSGSIPQERTCVKAIADNAPAARVVAAAGGEWVSIKPASGSVVYAVGYVPTRAKPLRVRVVRVQYDFAPLAPQAAVLVDGDLNLAGNASLSGLVGSAHSNGDIALGNTTSASGFVAASGTVTPAPTPSNTSQITDCHLPTGTPPGTSCANSGSGQPPRTIPQVIPLESYPKSEYDLCATGAFGEIRGGPNHSTTPNMGADAVAKSGDELPCAGPVIQTLTNLNPIFNGFRLQSGTWQYTTTATFNGVYYAKLSGIDIGGSPGSTASPWQVTLITDCTPMGTTLAAAKTAELAAHTTHTATCDISATGGARMRSHIKAYPLLMASGRDLDLRGNPSNPGGFEGVMAAHEQFAIAGNSSYTGVLLANSEVHTNASPVGSQCPGTGFSFCNNIQGNPNITYDGNLEVPFGDTIRITHWQEL